MDKNLRRLLKDLTNPDEDLRALSAMTLMKVDVSEPAVREEAVQALMKATQDKNVSVRFFSRRAIDKIKRQKQEEGVAPAASSPESALASEDFEVRLDAVMRIAREKKSELKDQLVQLLQTEQHDFVRASLISCLKLFLTKEEGEMLSRFLNDPDNRVRSNTIEALEYLKMEKAIPLLFPALEDPDNRIRSVAAKALASFGEKKVFTVLKKMLNSKEDWMKNSSIFALSHIQSGEAIRLLIDAAKPPNLPETRLKAVIALANYHDTSSFGFLRYTSTAGEEPFKGAAIRALKLHEEKFGATSPSITLVEQETTPQTLEQKAKEKAAANAPPPKTNLASTVSQFFRKGKEEAVDMSKKAAINFAINDLKKEQKELQKEAGRVLFENYQRGDLHVPELLTIGHEILRINYLIQKYTDEETKRCADGSKGGFFASLKALFSSEEAKPSVSSQIDKFTAKREEMFQRLGEKAFFKMKIQEIAPPELDGYFQAYTQLETRIQKEKDTDFT
jgi:HEAT repeat protein